MPPPGSPTAGCAAPRRRRQVLGLQQVRDVGAVPDTAGRIVEREVHAAHLVDERRLQRVEQRERLECGDALRRRWQLGDLEGPVGRSQRLDPARLVGRQIGLLEPGGLADRSCDRAGIERRRPLAGDAAQCRRELG